MAPRNSTRTNLCKKQYQLIYRLPSTTKMSGDGGTLTHGQTASSQVPFDGRALAAKPGYTEQESPFSENTPGDTCCY